jgi:hypothetical protein
MAWEAIAPTSPLFLTCWIFSAGLRRRARFAGQRRTGAVTSEITALGNDMSREHQGRQGSPIRLEDLDEIAA